MLRQPVEVEVRCVVVSSTGSIMSTVFGIIAVVVIVVLAAIAAAAVAMGSKVSLSLGSRTIFARPFFFGIVTTLIAARFMSCSSSDLASELSDSSSSSDKAHIVLISAAIFSGNGCVVIVGLAM